MQGLFAPLPTAGPLRLDDIVRRVPAALEAAAEPCRVPVDSALAGHAAFIRFLMVATGTRRYAELGTYRGRSLFTAAQAARHLTPAPQCIGIDTWQGDRHTTHYDDAIGAGVRRTAADAFPDTVVTIQGTFDQARSRFADGSLDLLLIDGLHTYEAVRHDFETWQPTLSNRGIVLLHDSTHVGGDFGVWRYVADLRRSHPMLELRHTEGLAVVVVGDADPALQGMLATLASQPDVGNALEALTHAMGQMSCSHGDADSLIDALMPRLMQTDNTLDPDAFKMLNQRTERLARHGTIPVRHTVDTGHSMRHRYLRWADRLWVAGRAIERRITRR